MKDLWKESSEASASLLSFMVTSEFCNSGPVAILVHYSEAIIRINDLASRTRRVKLSFLMARKHVPL